MVRIGRAFGDFLIITPVLKYLKELGHEVYFLGGEAAEQIGKRNPNIDKFILYKENTVTVDKLDEFFKATADAYECEKIIDFTGSLENSLLRHPNQPEYNDTKPERIATCDKNVYDHAFSWAGYPEVTGKTGELYFDPIEEKEIENYIQNVRGKGGLVILWGLAGSGGNKAWPYYSYVWNDIIQKYKNVSIISVGDKACEILELAMKKHPRYIPQSGKWSMMQSMAATKHVDLVVSVDTGLYHAKGCFDTPGISLLGHGTKWHTAGNFKNDYSLETDHEIVSCSPCYHLVYESWQCPYDEESGACLCMGKGLSRERVKNHIFSVIDKILLGELKYGK